MKAKLFLQMLGLALALVPASLKAQYYVFTNNNVPGATNSVTAFSVNPSNGALTKLGTTTTGGNGACGLAAIATIVTSPNGNFAYAANCGSNNITVFSVNRATGALKDIQDIGTGGDDSIGMSLAITQDGKNLYAANVGFTIFPNVGGSITTFSVAPDGTLTSLGRPMTLSAGAPEGIKIRPDGESLAVALAAEGSFFKLTFLEEIAMYNIGPGGMLTSVLGSPFKAPVAGSEPILAGVDFKCGGKMLFAGIDNRSETVVDTFDVDSTGALSANALDPFTFFSGTGVNSAAVLYNSFAQTLFVSNQISSTVSGFTVNSKGDLKPGPNSPVALAGRPRLPQGMAANRVVDPMTGRETTLVYIADFGGKVSVLSEASDGTLTEVPGSPFATGVFGFNNSLAVNPAGVCK